MTDQSNIPPPQPEPLEELDTIAETPDGELVTPAEAELGSSEALPIADADPNTADGTSPQDNEEDSEASAEKPDETPSDGAADKDGATPDPVEQAQETRRQFDENLNEATEQVDQDQKNQERARTAEFERRRISISRIDKADLERVSRLYVKPSTYATFAAEVFTQDLKRLKSKNARIWLVVGTSRSGRVMTAIHLALDLKELEKVDRAESVWIYTDSDRTLQDIAAERNLPPKSVIIFENVFDRGRMSPDALLSQVSSLNTDLKQRQVHFIFTVPNKDESFPFQDLVGRYPIFYAAQPDLIEVFNRLVDSYFDEMYYPEENKRLKALSSNVSAFQAPRRAADIDYGFRLHGADAADLEAWLLGKEYQVSQATRNWFEKLPNFNYKLYALLVVLFEGLDLVWLDQIYEASVAQLRGMGMDGDDQFIDPRRIGRHALESTLQLRRRGNQIDFIDDIYRSEVQRQIENNQRLLWTLVDSFIEVVKTMNQSFIDTRKQHSKLHRRKAAQDDPLLRRRLNAAAQDMDNIRHLRDVIATALANLGVFHVERLRDKLDELAASDQAFVVLTASGILAHVARQGDHHDMVIDVLSDWVRRGDFDSMWAAAASISRVYEAVAQERALPEVDTQAVVTARQETDRNKDAARELLVEMGRLLEELARNYDKYDELYEKQKRDAITLAILNQLADEFAQLIQDGVRSGNLPSEFLSAYQAATPEERVHLAINTIPDAAQQVEKKVKTLFQTLYDSWRDQVRLGVINAVAYIAMTRPIEMIRLAESWVSGDNNNDPVWEIGYMALNRLFEQTNNLDAVLLEKRAFPLLRSFSTLMRIRRPPITGLMELLKALEHDEMVVEEQQQQHLDVTHLLTSDPLSTALRSSLNWYLKAIEMLEQQDVDEEKELSGDVEISVVSSPDKAILSLVEKRSEIWEAQVYPELLKAINHATSEQRDQFRQAIIDEWLVPEHEYFDRVRRVAHALIARSHVMDGLVMDLPQAQRLGVLVVDGAGDEAAINRMFALAQRLSALVPLCIMKLGDARKQYLEGFWNADYASLENQHYLTTSDLSQQGHRRPALLMPLLQPRDLSKRGMIAADTTYFVMVYATNPIADLSDFFETLPSASAAIPVTGNVFAQKRQEQAIQTEEQNWSWSGKLFIVSNQSQAIPAAARIHVSHISASAVNYAYRLLERQVTKMLHQMTTPTQMWDNIEAYLGLPIPSTAEELKPHIAHWLSLLNDIQHTHPRDDASLTIAWVLLALSREGRSGCQDAIAIIESMLQIEGERDDKVFSHHQMGMACARMLFNFYNAYPAQLTVEEHSSLLRLLPAFNRAARDYSDLISIWEVLITWAQSSAWLTLFQPRSEVDEEETDGSKLFESITTLEESQARAARVWLERYDRLPEFWELFSDLGKSVDEFIGLILRTHVYRQEINKYTKTKGKQTRKQPSLQAPLAEPHLTRLLSFIPQDLERDSVEVGVLDWQIEQLSLYQRELLTTGRKELLLQQARNMQTLAERLRDRLSRRLAGELPKLSEAEKLFGIIVVQGDHRKLSAKAAELAKMFATIRSEKRLTEVVLTIHREGSQDLVRFVRKLTKRKENDLYDGRKRLPLLGPALDRYNDAKVGFVIVLSEKLVLDYDDWGDREGWGERLWTIRPANAQWQPSRGEHLDLNESSDVIMEQISDRITQRMRIK